MCNNFQPSAEENESEFRSEAAKTIEELILFGVEERRNLGRLSALRIMLDIVYCMIAEEEVAHMAPESRERIMRIWWG